MYNLDLMDDLKNIVKELNEVIAKWKKLERISYLLSCLVSFYAGQIITD
jgi:hypothetical protein